MIFLVQHKTDDIDEKWETEERFEDLDEAIEYAVAESKRVFYTAHRVRIKGGDVLMKIKPLGALA